MEREELFTRSLFALDGVRFGRYFAEFPHPWLILPHIFGIIAIISTDFEIEFERLGEGIFVHRTAKISPQAELEAPVVVGAGSEIRRGAYLRGGAIVGEGCTVGNCCEVKHSVLFDGATLSHFNYAGDSVLGRGAHLGAGAILSNLKGDRSPVCIHAEERIPTGLKKCGSFLGDGAEIGCNAVLNPGCVVGKGSRIYPLVSLRGVVPPAAVVKR